MRTSTSLAFLATLTVLQIQSITAGKYFLFFVFIFEKFNAFRLRRRR